MQFAHQRWPLGLSCSNVPKRSDQSKFTRNQRSAIKRPHAIHHTPDNNRKLFGSSRRSLLATPALLCGCGLCRGATASPGGGGPRNSFLDRVFAENMFTGMAEYEKTIAPVKRQLFSQLRPAPVSSSLDVVEIGMGTGPSLQYYSRDKQHVSITAVDPNDFMRPFLYKNLDSQGWERENVTWIAGIAENLPLKENSVDAVVCTLVLCSVADVEKAVQEAKRVLRPGGQFLFIEHTIAQPNASFLFKTSQWVLNPLQRALADGCNLTRDPLPVIERAGFQSVESMRFEVEGLGLISPHVAGIAVA